MKLRSLTDRTVHANFEEALFAGLAPNGDLYYPESFPKFNLEELATYKNATEASVLAWILKQWLRDEISDADLDDIAKRAMNFPLPIVQVGDNKVLELFHGPTMAFKDIAARTLAQLMSHFAKGKEQRVTITVATSGDTGGAVADGFAGIDGVNVVILFPKGKVSPLQREQLVRVNPNVLPLEIDGVFDDCQQYVKQFFADPDFTKFNLTTANSINIGRLLPQMLFYVWSYLKQGMPEDMEFVVPSGNFGNLCAGVFAQKCGIPIRKFIAANNENDVAYQYLQTGEYKTKQTIQTISNAMDIGAPSNFVRILEAYNNDYPTVKENFEAFKISDPQTVVTMQQVQNEFGYILDPHTAVAWASARQLDPSEHRVILSTASPIKFATTMQQHPHIFVDDSEEIKKLQERTDRSVPTKNNYETVKKTMLEMLGKM